MNGWRPTEAIQDRYPVVYKKRKLTQINTSPINLTVALIMSSSVVLDLSILLMNDLDKSNTRQQACKLVLLPIMPHQELSL